MTPCVIQTKLLLGLTSLNLLYWSLRMNRRIGLPFGLKPICPPCLAMVYQILMDSTTSGQVRRSLRNAAVCHQTSGLWSISSSMFTKIVLSHRKQSRVLLMVLVTWVSSPGARLVTDITAWMVLLLLLGLTPPWLGIPLLCVLAWMYLPKRGICLMCQTNKV